MAILFRGLCAAGALLLLTACGTAPPASTTATAVPTGSAVGSPAASQSGTSASGAPSVSNSPSAPGANTVVLNAKGVDRTRFGSSEAEVTKLLTAKAGTADDSYSGPVCELDDATAYGRQVVYGAAVLLFESGANGKKSSPRKFTSWVVNLDQELPKSFALADTYPVDTTFAQLKATFPKGKLTRIALGESAVWVFRTPSGIWYRGDDNKTPQDVGAGAMGTCE